jgi:predicted HAD superfamily Cof-like phosphohydrolase
MQEFRIQFLLEEVLEYKEAVEEGNLEKAFDSLIDLVYVAIGTAYLQGLPFVEGWERVHRANMAKVRAERPSDSARGTAYDVVKPAGWVAPDLSDLVEDCGCSEE